MSLTDVGWTFMYRKYGMSRAKGSAGATMSTGYTGLKHDMVDINVHPTEALNEFF